ncbi:MAG: tetratricopeptide repeat protein [Prolixibacteraceae bacterium]|nr:tetratricopeptide repeat protein [Prolixibacteraceae bacterium]
MKTYRILLFLPIFIILQTSLRGQESAYYESVQQKIDMAKELFKKQKYISSFREFEKIQKQLETKSELYSEAEYYRSVAALKAGYSAGSKILNSFTENYAESPFINTAFYYLGEYQFERKQYLVAQRTFQNIDRKDLGKNELIKLKYMNGYSNLMEDNLDVALLEFYDIKDANNLYSKPATYYWAHIMYLQENYESALEGFTKLNNDPNYSRVIPLYVSHIYYKQEKYNEVVNYTTAIIDDVQEEDKTELSKIVGDSYFHLNDYEKAIPYLEAYFDATNLKTREDNYILGVCYYHTSQFEKATPLLENASKGNDELAQNAYYHLADCYLKTDDKEKAKLAFDAASKLDFDENIKEDALFSYAKLTYELSYSPFNETIKAFDNYISLYPNSERNAEAYRILTEVYMVTRNYNDAIESIEKIATKTPTILQAYQRVTFNRGLELFNNLAYNEAIRFFNLSIENGSYDRQINARSLFWKGEALYRIGDYNNAINSFSQFLTTAGASTVSEFNTAEYNLGYAYFKLEDYQNASSHFRKYVTANQNNRSEKLADALNRVGDYYFLNTDYQRAVQNYQQAYAMKTFDADYALFQISLCQGLTQNQNSKVQNLEKLLSEFPESDFEDDALYELGRAYERMSRNTDALKLYQQIIDEYEFSTYYQKALLQTGLIYYNNGDYNKSLVNYKEVVENYPGTPEAQAALSGIRNNYVELNNINEYFTYAQKLGTGVNVTVSEQDSLTFMAAERVYMAGESTAASQLQRYIQQFPNGSFATNAHFYLAESFYKEGKYSEANQNYTYVVNQPTNIFTEPALSRASELTFNAEKYQESLEMFNQLEKVSSGKWNVLKANTGQMRCYMILKNYSEAIKAAQKIKKSDVANETLIREANYAEGKSNYELGNINEALPSLKTVATDVTYEQGSEAKYLIIEIYFKQGKLKESENEIMDFIDKNTPFQYWLGKSFLVLADIYLNNGDEFQAKHTLKSLAENYSNNTDGIVAAASERLAAIEAQERMEQQNAIDSSYQIKIKEN